MEENTYRFPFFVYADGVARTISEAFLAKDAFVFIYNQTAFQPVYLASCFSVYQAHGDVFNRSPESAVTVTLNVRQVNEEIAVNRFPG